MRECVPRAAAIAELLTPGELTCLAMSEFDGLTQVQIGRRLGLTHQAISYRLRRGLAKLARAGLRRRAPDELPEAESISMSPFRMDALGPDELRLRW